MCPCTGSLKGLLTQSSRMGKVMLLIRAELLFHEYDLATQPCIEAEPSGDLRNAGKHHEATQRLARLAGRHCAATVTATPTSFSLKRKRVILLKKVTCFSQVGSSDGGGRSYDLCSVTHV